MMKAFYKHILVFLWFILSGYESFSCQSRDYVFAESPINLSCFSAENISDHPNLVTRIFGLTEQSILAMYEKRLSFSPNSPVGKGGCYFDAFRNSRHLEQCCKNIKELHPDRKFEDSASFFGLIAYSFNRTVEIWVQVDERCIRKIRSFNAGRAKTRINILFMGDSLFLLKERDDRYAEIR